MEEEQNTDGEPANGEMDVKTEPDSEVQFVNERHL